MEQVKKRSTVETTHKKDFYLSIYTYIKNNSKLPKADDLQWSEKDFKQRLNYYLSSLKRAGFIERIGYGVWQTVKEFSLLELKQVKTSKKKITRDTQLQPRIRGHAFQFTIQLPKILNWQKRRKYLDKKNIKYKPLNILGNGERIFFKGKKIWLTSKSLVVFEKSSYLSDSAKGSKNYAIYEMLQTIKSIESLLDTSFRINKNYKFKVSKQHYARLNCSLARQYRYDGKRLAIRQEDGTIWLWTDFSLSVDELETGNTVRSDIDMDEHINPFLTGLRNIKGYTPQWVTNSLGQLIKYQQHYAKNLNSHVRAVQRLGVGVEELRKDMAEIKTNRSQTKLNRWF